MRPGAAPTQQSWVGVFVFLVLISPAGIVATTSLRASTFAAWTAALFIPRLLALQSAEAMVQSTLLSQKRPGGNQWGRWHQRAQLSLLPAETTVKYVALYIALYIATC